MSMAERMRARKAYEIINAKANSNATLQGLSGVFGFPFTLLADGAVIFTHYGTMLNAIRNLYERAPVSEAAITSIVKGISKELLFDVVADKALGHVPVFGIYFNAICAKTMTWRLGTLFAILSARGEAIDDYEVKDVVKLIRMAFPQTDAFKFQQPTYPTFEKLVTSVAEDNVEQFEHLREDEKLARTAEREQELIKAGLMKPPESYHNHCWKCKAEIDSKYQEKCPFCKKYKCSKCGACMCGYTPW